MAIPLYDWKPRVCGAVEFDGSNDYYSVASLTGVVDGRSGILSYWFNNPTDSGNDEIILSALNTAAFIDFVVLAGLSAYGINCLDSNGTTVRAFVESSVALRAHTGTGWVHMLCSWDATAGVGHLYINDVNELDTATDAFNNGDIDYTPPNGWFIGAANTGATNRYGGHLAEFYFAPNQYLDFSVESNRRKFITKTKRPVPLGSDGSTPTGTAPAIYMRLNGGDVATAFNTNRGSGGDFTLTGTLVASTTVPSR